MAVKDEAMETRPDKARIVVADDHDLVREGFMRMLSREPGFEVVGEAENGRQALDLARKLLPDLVLMDVRMPDMDGLAATRAIKQETPRVSVLVVTTYDSPDYLLEAIEAGAAGYVLKDTRKSQLINTVRRVLEGDSPLNQELAMQLIRDLAVGSRERSAESPPVQSQKRSGATSLEALTPREIEVLRLLARGMSNPQIAEELFISRGTAKIHVQRIISKLGVSDRTQAAVRAIELGLVEPGAGS